MSNIKNMNQKVKFVNPTFRDYFKWNINEILRLQREYELLELPLNEIAILHNRSADVIAYKLLNEGFVKTMRSIRGIETCKDVNLLYKTGAPLWCEYDSEGSIYTYSSDEDSDSELDSEFELDFDSDCVSEYNDDMNKEWVDDNWSSECESEDSDDSETESTHSANETKRIDKLESSVSHMTNALNKLLDALSLGK